MNDKISRMQEELAGIIKGKENVTDKILMAILAGGHVLLEDVPGVGKTTTALALCRLMGLDFKRIQFTPDVVPSDVTGFTMYDKKEGVFRYCPGAVMCNMLLADEINRTSSKTQSALLEVMEEGHVTVDGQTYPVPDLFIVIATQNPLGTAGTQKLPESQLDRFMVRLSMGYPDAVSQKELLRDRQQRNPLDDAVQVLTAEEVLELQNQVRDVFISDPVLEYVTELTEKTRTHPSIALGVSPRGALALCRMTKAAAFLGGRDYVIPEDVKLVFKDVCTHRLVLEARARMADASAEYILQEILDQVYEPEVG